MFCMESNVPYFGGYNSFDYGGHNKYSSGILSDIFKVQPKRKVARQTSLVTFNKNAKNADSAKNDINNNKTFNNNAKDNDSSEKGKCQYNKDLIRTKLAELCKDSGRQQLFDKTYRTGPTRKTDELKADILYRFHLADVKELKYVRVEKIVDEFRDTIYDFCEKAGVKRIAITIDCDYNLLPTVKEAVQEVVFNPCGSNDINVKKQREFLEEGGKITFEIL